jgi:hypothetical protein
MMEFFTLLFPGSWSERRLKDVICVVIINISIPPRKVDGIHDCRFLFFKFGLGVSSSMNSLRGRGWRGMLPSRMA